ncbi:Rho guanine nucleotide exchange factor 7 [Trichinella sp. T8]|nr:Rho guanine nucleotide exchange factor 7 [Trichinella sp. T8]
MYDSYPDRGDTQRAVSVYRDMALSCAEICKQKEIELNLLTCTIVDWEGEPMHMLGDFISAATAYSLQQGPFHECSAGKPLLHLPRESSCRRMSLVFKGDETGTLDISEKNIDYVFAACDKDIDRLIANAVTIRGM